MFAETVPWHAFLNREDDRMTIPELLACFAAGSGLVLLFYILRTLWTDSITALATIPILLI